MTQRDPESAVRAAFDHMPEDIRDSATQLRALILSVAQDLPQTDGIVETLKWGQPSYLPKRPRVGTTVRIGCPLTGGLGLYVPCSTTLIEDFRDIAPDHYVFDGKRGVVFPDGQVKNDDALTVLIRRALTYHQR